MYVRRTAPEIDHKISHIPEKGIAETATRKDQSENPEVDTPKTLEALRVALLHEEEREDHVQKRKVVKDPDLPIVWPHEEKHSTGKRSQLSIKTLAHGYQNIVKGKMSRHGLFTQVMRRVNGEHAVPLANKYSFIDIIDDLGYTTPKQTLVKKSESVAEREEQMNDFHGEEQIICKPLPVLAFDIGVKDISVLAQPYDFEKMKRNLVPFECQIGFAVNGYIMRSGKSVGEKMRMYKQLEFDVLTGEKSAFLKE